MAQISSSQLFIQLLSKHYSNNEGKRGFGFDCTEIDNTVFSYLLVDFCQLDCIKKEEQKVCGILRKKEVFQSIHAVKKI